MPVELARSECIIDDTGKYCKTILNYTLHVLLKIIETRFLLYKKLYLE